MFFWIKVLTGIVATSAGAVAPFKLLSNSDQNLRSTKYFENSSLKEYFSNSRKEWTDLVKKGCKVATEEKELGGKAHNALFVCKGEKKEAKLFYYSLEESKSVFENSFKSSVREVEKVNYVGETEGKDAYLELGFSGDTNKKSIVLKGSNGWSNFENASAKDSCQVITPILGGERMGCQLVKGGENIFVNFEI